LTFTWTDDKSNEATVTWAYDADAIDLTDESEYNIIVEEGEPVYENYHLVLDAGDYTHLLQLSDLDNDGSTTSSIEFTDLFSGTKYEFTLGTDNKTDAYIDGQLYKIDGTQSTSYVEITWGDNAGDRDVGDVLTVFPRIEGKNGEFLAITNLTTVTLNTTTDMPSRIELPTGEVSLTPYNFSESGADDIVVTLSAYTGYSVGGDVNVSLSNTTVYNITVGKTSIGRTYYGIQPNADNETADIWVIGNDGTHPSAGADSVPESISAGLLLVEEEEGDNNNIYSIFIPANNETSGSTVQIMAGSPEFTSPYSPNDALKTDTYKTQYVDLYGVFVEKNTYNQDSVKIWYPDEQMTIDIFVLGPDGTVSSTGSTSGETVAKAVPLKAAIAKLDSEIENSHKSTKNLVLVGGPVVNTLVAELAADGKTKDRAWYLEQGAGTAIIDLVEDAFVSGKDALVVSGHSAADTRSAASIVQSYDDYASDLTGSGVVVKNNAISSELS
jgi:hypothetical protein